MIAIRPDRQERDRHVIEADDRRVSSSVAISHIQYAIGTVTEKG